MSFLLTIRVAGMPVRTVHAVAKDAATALSVVLSTVPLNAAVTVQPA